MLWTAATWLLANPDLRSLAAGLPDPCSPLKQAEALLDLRSRFIALMQSLRTGEEALFQCDAGTIQDVEQSAILDRLALWLSSPEQFSRWMAYVSKTGTDALPVLISRSASVPDHASVSANMRERQPGGASAFKDTAAISNSSGSREVSRLRCCGRQHLALEEPLDRTYAVTRVPHVSGAPAATAPRKTTPTQVGRRPRPGLLPLLACMRLCPHRGALPGGWCAC